MSALVVREASASDARPMGEVYYAGELGWLREHFPGGWPQGWFQMTSVEDAVRSCEGNLAGPAEGSRQWVAERGARVVGFAYAGPADQPAAHTGQVYALYVHPDAWGTGVGTAILGEAEWWLRAQGFGEAILWAVEGNTRSRVFYERRGWAADGVIRTAAGDMPLLRYRRALTAA